MLMIFIGEAAEQMAVNPTISLNNIVTSLCVCASIVCPKNKNVFFFYKKVMKMVFNNSMEYNFSNNLNCYDKNIDLFSYFLRILPIMIYCTCYKQLLKA